MSARGDAQAIALLQVKLTSGNRQMSVWRSLSGRSTAIGQVSVKGDAQTIALLRARLTCDIEKDVRLAAVTAIGQVAEKCPKGNQVVAGQPLR